MHFIIGVAAQKGGSSKSTTCHALGSFLGRALLIDFDSQMTLTSAVAGAYTATLHDVLTGKLSISDASVSALPAYPKDLLIIPGSPQLATLDAATAGDINRQYLLADTLESISGVIIVDCPAGQTVATIATLVAADLVIVPTHTAPAAFETLAGFERTIEMIKKRLNPRLEWVLLPTMFSERQVLDRDVLVTLQEHYGDRVFNTIPRRVAISERMASQFPCNEPAYQLFAQKDSAFQLYATSTRLSPAKNSLKFTFFHMTQLHALSKKGHAPWVP